VRFRVRKGILKAAILVAAGLGLLVAAAAGGYWYALDSTAVKYETAFVKPADIVRRVNRQGVAAAARESAMRSTAGGTVTEVLVSGGETVKAGDVLCRLSNPSVLVAADQARVSLELAKLREDELFRQAGAMQVTAPVPGRITSLAARTGDLVNQGAVAATIEATKTLSVEIMVPEHAATVVRPGLAARVSIPAVAGAVAPGLVTEVGGSLRGAPGSAGFPVRIQFTSPSGVVPGMTASVVMEVTGVRLPVSGKVAEDPGEVLVAPDKATVVSVCAVAGQEVAAREVLAVLDCPDLLVRRDQARLTYENIRRAYEDLVETYDPSLPYHVNLRQQYLKAKQTYDGLEAAVGQLEVASPCKGRVVSVAVREGDVLEAGAAVAQVVPLGSLVVKAQVPGGRLASLELGGRLLVDLPDSGRTSLIGTLTGISPQTPGLASEGYFEITVEVRGDVSSWPGAAARVILPEGPETVEAVGQVTSESQESVRFGASGAVSLVMVQEGDEVAAGDVLYVLVNEALLTGAASWSGQAPSREELASRAGASLREEMLRTRAAELTYEQRRAEAAGLTLRAPHDGTVAEVRYRAGDVVSPGAQVLSIIDTSAVEILTDVGELDVARLEPGMEADVYFPAISQETFTGRLVDIGYTPTRGQEGAAYPLRFRLEGVQGVVPGMSCTVSIATDARTDVLAVPVEAVVERYGSPAVRVVRDEGQTEAQRLTAIQKAGRTYKGEVEWVYIITGISDGVHVEVVRGLPLHTEVVVREKETTR